jgi:hypothetical protein
MLKVCFFKLMSKDTLLFITKKVCVQPKMTEATEN